MKKSIFFPLLALLIACNNNTSQPPQTQEVNNIKIGILEKADPALDSIIAPGTQAEIISEGYDWSEGPVWVESQKMLLFSDVPRDTIFKWTEGKRKEVYLTPSGYTDTVKRGGEMGSNGLTLDREGRLVLCQCGNRQIARMDAPIDKPEPKYVSLANSYKGKKFNSPNDVVFNSKGEIFFTDPPYGLEKQMDDPKKEMPYQGVFKVKTNGEVILVTDTLTRPNGIAFLPGEKTLIIANSDPAKPNWYAFDVGDNDQFTHPRIFHSAAGYDKSLKGLPDGMKIDKNGNVFAAGPGGIWIFNKDGKLLGKYRVPDATSNCALSGDEKTLFITNDMYILRLKMRQ
ncbi:MAG: SMP-30/gluconolactonase/LRE family protein [Bacteroidota bacterium]|nr:SMP-30/gluconolactonase/LRE family protein [Bacteroidota bacterium]